MGTPTPADVAPRPALRASRLEAWDHCPRADRVEDVDRLPRPLADPRPRLLGEGAHGLRLDRLARAMAQRLTRFIPPHPGSPPRPPGREEGGRRLVTRRPPRQGASS